MGGSLFCDAYIKPAFRAQNTSKHTLVLYMHLYWCDDKNLLLYNKIDF